MLGSAGAQLVASRDGTTVSTVLCEGMNGFAQRAAAPPPAPPPARRRAIFDPRTSARAVGRHNPARAQERAPVETPTPAWATGPRPPPRLVQQRPLIVASKKRKAAPAPAPVAPVAPATDAEGAQGAQGAERAGRDAEPRVEYAGGTHGVATSRQDSADLAKFRTVLVNGKEGSGYAGIMREKNLLGLPNRPYEHQAEAVRKLANRYTDFMVLAHDMGLGKTATALMAHCAESVMNSRTIKTIVTAPSGTLKTTW